MNGKKRILMMQSEARPFGGREAVFAFALQSMCPVYEVTVFTWNDSLDTAGFNRQYGTTLAQTDFHLMRPSRMLGALCRFITAIDRDPGSIHHVLLLMRLTKRFAAMFDLAIACELETDFGLPGLQYIHYPWLGKFSSVLQAAEDLRGWQRIRGLFTGRVLPWMWLSGFSLRRMRGNRTLTNSDWTGRHVRAAYGIETTTLYPPAPGVYRSVAWEEKENGFLCIGRIHPVKRIDWLIEALEPLRFEMPDLHLHIVGKTGDQAGEREYFRLLRQLAQVHSSWVTIHPDLSRAELEDLAVRQRYGVHAMRDEHFGIAIAEMVRAGCIPFVHESGGAVEIVNRDSRLLYNSREELRSRILHIARDPAEREALSADLESGAARFSPERFMDDLRKVAESILKCPSYPPQA